MSEEALRVLLAEDDVGLREPLAGYLCGNYGYHVDAVADGEGTWERIVQAAQPYDVALIDDLLIPEPDSEPEPIGVDLMRRIKEHYPETEVIIFTGWGMDRALEALRAGAYRYLAKPLNLDELGMTIRMAAEHRQLKRQLETTRREKEWLQTFLEIGRATTAVLQLDEVLELVHEQVGRLMDASCLDVILYDEDSQTLHFKLGYDRGEREDAWERPFTQGHGLTDWVIEHCQPLLLKDCLNETLPVPAYQRGDASRSWLGVPMVARDRVVGAITVQSYEPRQFDETHQQILTTVASQVASAIERSRLFSELTETKDRLDALVASSFDAVIAIDQDGKIAVFNQRAEEMFGWTASEMIGRTVARLHVDIEKAREIFDAVNRDGVILEWRMELKHRDVRTIPVLLSAALIRDSRGVPIGQAGFMRDLQQVNLLEERVRALMEVTQMVTGALTLDDVLELVTQSAVAAFPAAHWGTIHLYDERASVLRPQVNLYDLSAEAVEALTFSVGEGIAGWVYEHRASVVVDDVLQDPRYKRVNFSEIPSHRSFICVPLQVRGRVIGTLSLDNRDIPGAFQAEDLGLLRSFADQAAIAIANAQSFREIEAYARYMDALVKAGQELAKTFELDRQLDIVWQFVRDQFEVSTYFVAIYDRVTDRVGFPLAYDMGQPVSVSEYCLGDPGEWGMVGHVVKKGQEYYWASEDERQVVQGLLEVRPRLTVGPCTSGIFLPLRMGDVILGAISIQSPAPYAFDPVMKNVFRALVSQMTTAIKSAELYQEAQEGLQKLRSLYEGSSAIISTMDPERILDVIVQKACDAFGAWRAEVIRITEAGEPIQLAALGFGMQPDITTWIRSDGVSVRVMQSGRSCIIENVKAQHDIVNPGMLQDGVGSAVCIPLNLRGKNIGVMWIQLKDPRRFLPAEVESLHLYANQAAIAYDNARRMRELEHMRRAAEKLASVAEVREVLQQIVRSARDTLGADSVVIWSYDAVRNTFLPDELVADGVDPELLDRFREDEPHPGGTADVVIRQAYLAVSNVDDPEYTYLGPAARGLRGAIGAKSFQGIALRVGDETLGVLYVNFKLRRAFSGEARSTLETFAHHAALILKKARLLEQVSKARDTARVVAQVSVLEDLQSTLHSVAKGSRDALHCDAVTLYTYNQSRDEFGVPPAMVGVHDEDVLRSESGLRESVVRKILTLDDAYVVEYAPSDPIVDGTFVKREGIKSSVSIPLKVGDRKVGVMFVNYRSRHRFTGEDLINIELFANQAAVAIRNAQLYEETARRANALQALYEAGTAVSSTLALDEILTHIVEQAWRFTSRRGERTHFSHLALKEGNVLKFDAAYPSEHLPGLQSVVGCIDLERDARIGITGRAAKTGLAQQVDDVDQDPDYIAYIPEVRSEMAVPIKLGEEVIGVINVEHPDDNAFDEGDQRDLESLAVQASIAIQNARQFRLREGLLKAGEVVTAEGELYPALQVIAQSVKETIGCDVVSLYTYDRKKCEISYPSVVVGELRKPQDQANWRLVSRERKLQIDLLDKDWVIRKLLDYGASRFAPCSAEDPILGAGEFVAREGIESSAGILLKVGEEVVGILFVNYRSAHHFGEEEKQATELFAYQAAVAIRNAQLYEDLTKRANALQALYKAGTAVTSTLALDEILDRIVEQAKSFTGRYGKQARYSDLELVEGNRLRPKSAHPPERLAELQRIAGNIDLEQDEAVGITGRAARTGCSQLVGDVTKDPDYVECNPGVRSELAVPIKLGEDVVGVINVEHPDYNAFDEDNQRDLESLAAQAAVAIENARLFRETQRRALQLAVASEVARDATAILDVRRLLNETVRLISERFGFYHAGVFLLDDRGEYAVLHAASSEGGRRMLKRGHKLKVGEVGIVGFVTGTGKPRIALDVGRDAVHFSNPDLPDTRSEMALPFSVRGQVIGALDVQCKEVSAFTGEDVAALQIMADHLANAIANARLYERLQQEAEQLALINQLAAEVSSTLDLDKILRTLVNQLARVIGVEQCAIAIFNEDGEYGDVVAEYLEEGCVPSMGTRIPLRDNSIIELVRQTKMPAAVRDAQHDPRMERIWDIMRQRQTQSIMIVPIVIRGDVVGTIGLDAVSGPRDFTAEEQWLAETIAHHASIALQNARRYEELKHTKGLVGARTALAWMGMTSSAWRHAIGNYATTIQDLVVLAQQDIAASAKAADVRERLARIEHMADKIRTAPITAPLHAEEGVGSVAINELLRERVRQLQGREPCKSVQFAFGLEVDESITVRASPDWLRRAFDILIDNAVEAMADSATRQLTIATHLSNGGIELAVTDTGKGIPNEVAQRLFQAPIPRPKGSKGLGVGLLMAHTIVQTYGGDVRLASTGPSGTTIVIWLPIER